MPVENDDVVREVIPYRRVRLMHLAVAALATVLLLGFGSLAWYWRLLLPLAGAVVGRLEGRRVWRRLRERIDQRNVVILYFTDSKFYLLLIGLFILKTAKLAAFRVAWWAVSYPALAEGLMLLVVGAWCGHGIEMYLALRRYESRHGELQVKSFYGRSVTGQQGMIGLTGRVTRRCAPRGKVEVRGEVWDALSIDGAALERDEFVVVRDINELELVVERTGA